MIRRPIEEVFDFVADERNEPAYNPQMTLAEKLTDGPVGVGTRFHAVMARRGVTTDMVVEFTEFDRPHRIVETTRVGTMMVIDGELRFDEVPAGTRMTWIWDLHTHGLYRFFGPVIRRMGERQELGIWTGMKNLLESERPSGTARGG